MKYILLASASAFAFAGAAAAEVTFSGSAELGYNDTTITGVTDDWGDSVDNNDAGFYWSAKLYASLTQELNNGLTAGAAVTIKLADGALDRDLSATDYVLWLESENAGLYFGTTDTAAGKHWSGTSGMDADAFTTSAADYTIYNDRFHNIPPVHPGHFNSDGNVGAAVLRGDISYGGIDASVSYLIPSGASAPNYHSAWFDTPVTSNVAGELEQLSVGASGSFGNFNFALAYQDGMDATVERGGSVSAGDFSTDRVYGISVGTTFGGADVTLAYAHTDASGGTAFSSLGIEGSYPIGPVTVGAYYVNQPDAPKGNRYGISADYASGPFGVSVAWDHRDNATAPTRNNDWSIDASYDVGNGLTVYAGAVTSGDASYIGGEFDMGNGATLGLSYAKDKNHGEEDDIGARGYQEGATAWVSFTF